MTFSLSLVGAFTDDEFDEYDNKNIKQTAVGYITREQIQNCYKSKAYYYTEFGGDLVYCDAIDIASYNYYYDVWSNTHEFGLPNGSGWINERPVILKVIKEMNSIYNKTTELMRSKK